MEDLMEETETGMTEIMEIGEGATEMTTEVMEEEETEMTIGGMDVATEITAEAMAGEEINC
jgi:hypothetical protein